MIHMENELIHAQTPNILMKVMQNGKLKQFLKHREFRNRKEYLVKWKDYPIHEATWEPLKNLKGTADELIKEYENKIKNK